MYTFIERILFRGNTSVQGARYGSPVDPLRTCNVLTVQQRLGLLATFRRGRKDIPRQSVLCFGTLQHTDLDHTFDCEPLHCRSYPEHQLHWSSMRSSYRLSMGPRIHKVFGASGKDFEMDRGQAESARKTASLCVGGPKDIWEIRCSAIVILAQDSAHIELRQRNTHDLCGKHSTSWTMSSSTNTFFMAALIF